MGWLIFIGVLILVSAMISRFQEEDKSSGDEYLIDEEDPDNPHYEEMQEEFFDEFEDY